MDIPPVKGTDLKGEELIERPPVDAEPLCALAFKVALDDGRKTVFLRIYSGVLKPGDDLYNPRLKKKEKVARLFSVHANRRERITEAGAGSIVVAMGLKNTATGDTLCPADKPILLERIGQMEPVISRAVEPKTQADKDKMDFGLDKFADEDPTFRCEEDADTGQTIIRGMGELHLDIIVDRLRREYGVDVNVGRPEVVYRETIKAQGKGDATFARETESQQLFGHAALTLTPAERGSGNGLAMRLSAFPDVSEDGKAPDDGSVPIPQDVLDAVMEGVREAMHTGVQGYPLEDVAAEIHGNHLRPRDFLTGRTPGRGRRGVPECPEQSQAGTAGAHHGSRNHGPRGQHWRRVGGSEQPPCPNRRRGFPRDERVLNAMVPLRRMFGYSTALRSATQGRATFTMNF